MNFIIWIYLALATWPNAFAIYHTGSKQVFQPPTDRLLREDSYFGYSITYDGINKKLKDSNDCIPSIKYYVSGSKGLRRCGALYAASNIKLGDYSPQTTEYHPRKSCDRPRLIISAPRENDIGEVYNCNIENRSCTPIVNTIIKRVSPVSYTHDYWFGATVKAGRDFVMMCAPRYITKSAIREEGRCYSFANGNLTEKETINDVEREQDVSSTKPLVQLTMDSFGWSIDVASDDSIIVGGPGMFHGRAMIYKNISDKNPSFIKKSDHTPEFNFGYAVASGSFINESLSYAVGSPYGTRDFGEVAFHEGLIFIENLNNPLKSSKMGSMFGAVLCNATLYGNRTDLLVGAPTYATAKTYDRGAVYVYLAVTVNSAPVFKRKIVGQESGSMFGSAIVNVGDLNGDEKHEIAIGAPFEKDGQGVVYLYNGADLISDLAERDLKYLQRIEPEASYGESFGMSLTPLLDYDENGCKELAIGSPYKDTVVLLRCMAAIVVKTSATFPNLQNRSNTKDFEFEICLSIKYPSLPKEIIAVLSTTVEMDHEYAKLSDTNGTGRITYETSLEDKRHKYCKNVSFILPSEGKYDTKISYTISSKLLLDPRTLSEFNSSRVVLSDRSVLTIHDSLWAAECANNKTCEPHLILTPNISFHHNDDPYIIGSSKIETMSFTVVNDGEVAYEPCVRVHFFGVNVLKTPSGCVHEGLAHGNGIICEPHKPIRNNKNWTTDPIVLEMLHLTNLDEYEVITIITYLHNHCYSFADKTIISIPLKADSRGIDAKGETDIGSIVNMTKVDIKQNGKKMQHIYTITNKGPTNWKKLPVQVTLQKQTYIKYTVTVQNSTLDIYTPCHSQAESTYVCMVDSLTKNLESPSIHIQIDIVPGLLDGVLDKDKNVTVVTYIKLEFSDGFFINKSVHTTLTLQEAIVPIETTIIAVVVGLCIIIIISIILYRVGFLRREKKEALKRLKTQVKRQTILRASMRQSHGPASGDQNPILVNQEECGLVNTGLQIN